MNAREIANFWFLKEFDFFEKLSKKYLVEISHELEMINVPKGSELLINGKNKGVIFLLKSGTVKIVAEPNNYTKYIIKKGNVFGELNLIEEKLNEEPSNEYNERAIALEDAVLYFIEVSLMKKIISQHNSLKNEILNLYGSKVKQLERRLEDFLYKDGRTRIKEYVFNYLLEFGIKEGDILEAKNLLSHSDIAHLTCTSRQTVNNVMSTLRKEGLINYDSKRIYRLTKLED